MEIYLASNLKLLRKYRKMSQEDVAKELGLTRSSYSGYENGVAEPGIENLVKMSKFYRIPMDDLLKRNMNELTESESEEHTFELQSRPHLVCRLLLEKKKKRKHK